MGSVCHVNQGGRPAHAARHDAEHEHASLVKCEDTRKIDHLTDLEDSLHLPSAPNRTTRSVRTSPASVLLALADEAASIVVRGGVSVYFPIVRSAVSVGERPARRQEQDEVATVRLPVDFGGYRSNEACQCVRWGWCGGVCRSVCVASMLGRRTDEI